MLFFYISLMNNVTEDNSHNIDIIYPDTMHTAHTCTHAPCSTKMCTWTCTYLLDINIDCINVANDMHDNAYQ